MVLQLLQHVSRSMTKPTKWHKCPAKTQISLGIRRLTRVFAVRMKEACVLSYQLSAQRRLIRLGECPGWSESSLDAQVIWLVLSCCGSCIYDMHVYKQFQAPTANKIIQPMELYKGTYWCKSLMRLQLHDDDWKNCLGFLVCFLVCWLNGFY